MDDLKDFIKYRILTKYREAKQLMCGEMVPPRFVDLYPVYGCNHNCLGCDYQELNGKPKMWGHEEFRSLLYELDDLGCEAVDYCGGGEPTLNPHLAEMIDLWCEDMGHKVGLLTNGTMMSGKLMESVVNNASYVRFSLESATKETFNRYKRPKTEAAGFDTVINNLRETIKYRDMIGSRCSIGYKYTIDQNNLCDIEAAFKLCRNLGVDTLQFKLIRNVESELSKDKIVDVSHLINTLSKCYLDVKVLANFDNYTFRGNCWLNPLWPTIDANGDIWICCYYRHRKDKHYLGNINKNSLKYIWYNQEHFKKMEGIDKCDCLKYDCRFMKYNDMMHDIMFDDLGDVEFI